MALTHKKSPGRSEHRGRGSDLQTHTQRNAQKHQAALPCCVHPRQTGSSSLPSRAAAFTYLYLFIKEKSFPWKKKYLLQESMLETGKTPIFLRGFNSCLCQGLFSLLRGKISALIPAEIDFRPGAESE